jgi:hypothetical protein
MPANSHLPDSRDGEQRFHPGAVWTLSLLECGSGLSRLDRISLIYLDLRLSPTVCCPVLFLAVSDGLVSTP